MVQNIDRIIIHRYKYIMYYFLDMYRFFGVHCNECKEVITDRVMKAGDRVRVAVFRCHKHSFTSLISLPPGLPC